MPVPIKDNLKQLNMISDKLLNTMDNLSNKKTTVSEANSISRLACQAIKANATGVMLANQHEIERSKIQLQYERIQERKKRNNK